MGLPSSPADEGHWWRGGVDEKFETGACRGCPWAQRDRNAGIDLVLGQQRPWVSLARAAFPVRGPPSHRGGNEARRRCWGCPRHDKPDALGLRHSFLLVEPSFKIGEFHLKIQIFQIPLVNQMMWLELKNQPLWARPTSLPRVPLLLWVSGGSLYALGLQYPELLQFWRQQPSTDLLPYVKNFPDKICTSQEPRGPTCHTLPYSLPPYPICHQCGSHIPLDLFHSHICKPPPCPKPPSPPFGPLQRNHLSSVPKATLAHCGKNH